MPDLAPSFVPADDPTGNGQTAYRIEAGGVTCNAFLVLHGGQTLKLVRANAPSDAASAFSIDEAGRLLVEG